MINLSDSYNFVYRTWRFSLFGRAFKIPLPHRALFKKELPIGLLSHGWVFLFKASKYYSTYDEVIEFYTKYHRSLEIICIPPFGELSYVSFGDMLEQINYAQFKTTRRSYYFNKIPFSDVKIDKYEYEFNTKECDDA